MSRLQKAHETVKRIEWFTYCNVPHGQTLHIDRRLAEALPVGGFGLGQEMLCHWVAACRRHGVPEENPAQLEVFIGPERVPVYFATVDGKVFVASEPLFPFE